MARADGETRLRTKQVVVQPVSPTKMVVLSGRRTLQISTDESIDPWLAWSLLQAGEPLEAVAGALGCAPAALRAFVDRLEAAGLLVPESEGGKADGVGPALPKAAAIELIQDTATMWKRHSLIHPIFSLLEDETERPALALGLLVEICHYARLFPISGARAASSLAGTDAGAMLSAFAEEEMPHHEAMAEALAAHLDVPVEAVLGSRPSPSMQLLLSFLDETAGADGAVFSSVLSLVEMNDAPAELSADAFEALADSNGLPRELFAPFGNHAREDDALDHGQVAFDVLVASLGESIDPDELDRILNFLHDVKHGFDLVYDQLVSRWADPDQRYKLRGSVQWQLL